MDDDLNFKPFTFGQNKKKIQHSIQQAFHPSRNSIFTLKILDTHEKLLSW
jgi:hypothetical protein